MACNFRQVVVESPDFWTNILKKENLNDVVDMGLTLGDLTDVYTGKDDVKKFLHLLATKSTYTLKELSRKPMEMSCKWYVEMCNVYQCIDFKHHILNCPKTLHSATLKSNFENLKNMLNTISKNDILEITRLIRCHYKCAIIASKKKHVDLFNDTIKITQN